jgi:hypothetical protein
MERDEGCLLDRDAFSVLFRAYESLDYPAVPLEQSIKNIDALYTLHNAMMHLLRTGGAINDVHFH